MDKIGVSVVVLTKNEEANIKDCLNSVAGWADEIIVVDDESSDNTVRIAKEYTDKILIKKMDIEGRHRNWAYAQAENDWVLSLDADERLTKELQDEITQALSTNKEYNAFNMPRKNYIGDYWVKHGGWYPSAQLRLFKKDKFKYEEVSVHPRAFLDGECGSLTSDMIHYSYKDFTDFLNKQNRQTTLEAEKWFNGNKPMTLSRFMRRTIDRFMRTYIRKKAYKDGFMGFMVALFAGLYQIISYAKYWEMKRKNKK